MINGITVCATNTGPLADVELERCPASVISLQLAQSGEWINSQNA